MDCFVAALLAMTAKLASEHGDIFQQREHAENDDDDPADLLGAAIDRQHVDQIKNENDDEKGDERADEKRHRRAPFGSPCWNAQLPFRFRDWNRKVRTTS